LTAHPGKAEDVGLGKKKKGAKKAPPAFEYDKELARLQAELVKLQLWVKETGARDRDF
jgi:polyphosphate kinase 2 (PPK2 family)